MRFELVLGGVRIRDSQRYYVSGHHAYLRKDDWKLPHDVMMKWYADHPGQWIRAYSAKEAVAAATLGN